MHDKEKIKKKLCLKNKKMITTLLIIESTESDNG